MVVWKCGHQGCENREFKTKYFRDLHVKRVHQPRQLKCDVIVRFNKPCNKSYATQWDLDYHKRCAHSDEAKIFKCTEEGCEKAFFRKRNLLKHVESYARAREKKERTLVERELVAVPTDPTSKLSREMMRLRKIERTRTTPPTEERTYQFNPAMMAEVKNYNDVMIGKPITIAESTTDSGTYFCLSQAPSPDHYPYSSPSLSGPKDP